MASSNSLRTVDTPPWRRCKPVRGQEAYNVSNQSAATFGPFVLQGGLYQLSAIGTWGGGNLILQQIGPDGTTAMTLFGQPSTATPATNVGSLLANGIVYFYLPPGAYQLVYATGTALFASLARIPLE